MQIQINGNFSSGVWLPVAPQQKCMISGRNNPPRRTACNWDVNTQQHTDGFDEVQVKVPPSLMANITAIRYAWGESPCCTGIDTSIIPCQPQSCPIQTANSTMPAVPFWATIKGGECDWVSTSGKAP